MTENINKFLNTYLDKIELFKESSVQLNSFSDMKSKITNRPEKSDLSSALLTTDDLEEFEFAIKALAESYGIKLTGHISQELYRAKLTLLKIYLTKLLFSDRYSKNADKYLKVLEKRFKKSWNDKYTESEDDDNIEITFKVVEHEKDDDESERNF